ncbi:MAG: hypothetical protein IKO10_18060 [Lachnospiraceae bacterium]|nr:hypothetical protein [Lachnospiraceae bacterium]
MSDVTSPINLDQTQQQVAANLALIAEAITRGNGGVVYGFHIDGNEDDPASNVTYLRDAVGMTPTKMDYTAGKFDYGTWGDAFFMPRPCMVKQDGSVDYYLDPNDYSKKADGTASDVADTAYNGNAMMEWGKDGKKIWMKIVPDANDEKSGSVFIADHKADDDFHDYPFHNSKGVSVPHFYTPIYNGAIIDSKMRSISGTQVSKTKTAQQEIDAAQLNNAVAADVIWNTELFSDIQLINALLILIGKSTDTQTTFGEGLHTGGSEAINDNFRTGVHDAKGLFYGTNSGAIADGSYGNAVKIFGMENWWGFQWRRYQGHIMVDGVQKVKNTYGTEDGSTVSAYNLTGNGYISVGATPTGTSGQYLCEMLFSPRGILPKKADSTVGASSKYYCDGFWFNNSGTRVPSRGGRSGDGALDGAFYASLNYAASYAWWHLGAGLSCKPLA